ncbi:hypothetical protein [Thermococcus thioreducens]|uniref:Helix-turn-helix domain-containing protein n=1 Tax=Thermococcus thioreducens TaxID=277988 RepID=A0A0Q2S6T9_9EURY|nr:hypothetical protein [Thermococcus thioreducens]ASJ12400.1 hypothetical protein A3L14_05615 [Thermococcus thioreducens]KQH83131.1 hypothetical protein AMR53_02620 [Thermococcus thioreducens]SEV91498.1 hypothetical protein SAMN05216170_0834 [Thermococcus thioreducens]
MAKKYYTIQEFTRIFMVPEEEVFWATVSGRLKYKVIDGKTMIPRSEVLRLLRRLNPCITEKDLDVLEAMVMLKEKH